MQMSALLSLVTQLEHLLHKLSIFPAKHQQLLVKQADVKISFSFISFRIKLIQVYLILQKKKKVPLTDSRILTHIPLTAINASSKVLTHWPLDKPHIISKKHSPELTLQTDRLRFDFSYEG